MAGKAEYSITFTHNRIPEVLKDLDKFVVAGLDMWAFGVVSMAAADAPYQTGGLKSSGFRISSIVDTFGNAVGAMQGANPSAHPINKPEPPENGVVLGFAADYARAVHDGHHTRSGSFVPGRPFFQAAVEARMPELSTTLHKYLKALLEGGSVPAPEGQ